MERGNDPISPAAAASLLQWWADAGVDMLVDEAPRDWLRAKAAPTIALDNVDHNRSSRALRLPPAAAAQDEPRSRGAGTAASHTPLDYARDERGRDGQPDALPDQLELFRGYLRDATTLPFASPAVKRVCPAGDPASGLMIMTDMPAAEDCGTGTLISGEVGRLFDRMLAAIGRDRDSVYLASLSCLRSPDGRFTSEASKECARLALHHIGLAAPRALLVFGDAPAKALLGLSMIQARGRWHELATHAGPVRTIVSFPPSYLLKLPSAKALAWADLQMLIEGLET